MASLKERSVWPVTLLLLGGVYSSACVHREPAESLPRSTTPSGAPSSDPVSRQPGGRSGNLPTNSFAIYGLSRGKGVPTEASEAILRVGKLVEDDQKRGVSVTVKTTRIGLEGETRVCVEYKDPVDAARAFESAKMIVRGIDLVNLVAEPCATPAP
jgi:hypothetical protein